MTVSPTARDTDGMSDPHVLGPGTAPTPFTAHEIRAGCPDERTITLLVEPAGGPAWQRVNRFVAPDADGATLQRWRIGPDGERVGEIEEARTTWLQLQGHASFPESLVTIHPETLVLP